MSFFCGIIGNITFFFILFVEPYLSQKSYGYSSEHTRAVQKVSNLFEYLKNWSRGCDVSWQPVRGDLTVHPWTVTLPWGLVSRQWDAVAVLVYSVTTAFTNLLPFNGDFSFGKSQEVAGSQIWAVGVLTDLGNSMFCQKYLHKSCRMGRRIDADWLICSLGHCECDCKEWPFFSRRTHIQITAAHNHNPFFLIEWCCVVLSGTLACMLSVLLLFCVFCWLYESEVQKHTCGEKVSINLHRISLLLAAKLNIMRGENTSSLFVKR